MSRRRGRDEVGGQDKHNASSGQERKRGGKLVDALLDRQPRASSCRDNLHKPVAPRRQGSWYFDHFAQ